LLIQKVPTLWPSILAIHFIIVSILYNLFFVLEFILNRKCRWTLQNNEGAVWI